MDKETYIKQIIKLVDCNNAKKRRLATDLDNDISRRLEQGQSMEQVIDSMGSPEEIAADLTDNISTGQEPKAVSQGLFYLVGACCIFLAGFLMNLILVRLMDGTTADFSMREAMICMMCWLIVLIVLLVVEAATMGLTTIWFAGGAFVALIIALLRFSPTVQVVGFCIATALLLFLTRPLAMKSFNKNKAKTNVDSLIGKTVIVTEDIDNVEGKGEAVVDGLTWMARSISEDICIKAGTRVQIIRISGVKLIVKENKNEL